MPDTPEIPEVRWVWVSLKRVRMFCPRCGYLSRPRTVDDPRLVPLICRHCPYAGRVSLGDREKGGSHGGRPTA